MERIDPKKETQCRAAAESVNQASSSRKAIHCSAVLGVQEQHERIVHCECSECHASIYVGERECPMCGAGL